MRISRYLSILSGILISAIVSVGAFCATPALALVPALTTDTVSVPTSLPPGGEGQLAIRVENLGDATADGKTTPIVTSDKLPAGLTATAVSAEEGFTDIPAGKGPECILATLRCEYQGKVPPYGEINVYITVTVAADASATAVNEVSVGGGGAVGAVAREALTLSVAPAGFGVEKFKLVPTNEDGSVDTQAGSHPFQLTTTLGLTNGLNIGPEQLPGEGRPFALTKDLHFNLPVGLIGNPHAIPQCTTQEFDALIGRAEDACPAETAIGVAIVALRVGQGAFALPLFNLVPSAGEPARFGFSFLHVPVILDTSVRTGEDYGVTVSVNNIAQTLGFAWSQVTFWGVPADPRHDSTRGWGCLPNIFGSKSEPCVIPVRPRLIPFLSLPTSCSGPAGMRSVVGADSWVEPGVFKTDEYSLVEGAGDPLGLTGCNRLPFDPSLSVAPDSNAGSTPTGLTVGVHVSQEGALNPTGLSPADVKDTTVTLPAGVQVSPAGADGLESCSLGQVGLEVDGEVACPDASKVATAEVKSPLLPNPLVGAVYLASQDANPFGSLVAMYIVVRDPVSGVLVKLAGQVSLDPVSGQLVLTFDNTPQLPFEDLTLHFFGSARAPLTTPALCGTYTTQASIAPWSGNGAAEPSSSFQIVSGPNGSPCSDPQPFAPGFQAGSTNLQAGAFTPFTLTMSRPDGDQTLSRVEMKMPPGLLGTLSNVKLCAEPQASQGTCGPESLIGTTVVSAGLGNDPYTVTGGKVYITAAYGGGQYGLSIVNPAKAGPFDLGSVVVRASINVDPHTAALSIKSDPLPTIIDGIPLQIQHVNVTVDREKFTFNPTNCNKTQINATLSSTEGVKAPVSTSFQVTNCATLAFKPKLTASTSGKTSRANGASLHVKLSYPEGPYDANISKVKVDLPKQLPSRLTTLQKACPAQTFEANPASCPAASIVGHAKALTPVLPVPLEGPAYFVSHAGEEFPDLIIVLQGYGTSVDLVGSTFINSKTNVTSSTFKSVPDVPVGMFELTLPQGKYSALAATANVCTTKLKMPTSFIGQNGAEIHTTTPITPTGCTKNKKTKTSGRARGGRRHGKKK